MRALSSLLVFTLSCGAASARVGGGAGGSTATGTDGGTGGGTATGGDAGTAGGGGTPTSGGTGGGRFDAGITCPSLPPPDDSGVVMHPDFAVNYTSSELGGCVVLQNDRDHLLIAGASERPNGGLYRVRVRRNACGHIIGFLGTATKIADTPYIDANILELPGNSLLYTGWSVSQLSQLRLDAGAPLWTIDLATRGQVGSSAGGLGRVPPWLAAAGQFRIVGWPDGKWHRLTLTVDAGVYDVVNVVDTGVPALSGGPGGFAYVPVGSAQFTRASIILSEWTANQVSVIEVDPQGNPQPSTRRQLFSQFPLPWGSYFEPETGDFLFMTWGRSGLPDSVFIVQGFEKPPPVIN